MLAGQRHGAGGLHSSEAQVRAVCAAHSRAVPEEAVQEGAVPHCGEVSVARITPGTRHRNEMGYCAHYASKAASPGGTFTAAPDIRKASGSPLTANVGV